MSRTIPHRLGLSVWLALATGGATAQDQVRADLDRAARAVVSVEATIVDRALLGAGVVAIRQRDAVIVVTANHVVRQGPTEATRIVVHFKDKPQLALAATLLPGFDRTDDIAAFRVERLKEQGIDPCTLPALPFDTVQAVRRGHGVYPIGNPAGVAWRVPVTPDTVTELGDRSITFQSALIDSGHSGGGLFDTFGDLVGIIRADQPPYAVATRTDRAWALLRGWVPGMVDECAAAPAPAARASAPVSVGAARQAVVQAWTESPWMNIDRWRPLFDAVVAGDVEAVRRLVTPQALSPGNYDPPFPLHLAAALGQSDVVKQLLVMGAKKNAYVWATTPGSRFGDLLGTPLHVAARENQVEVMKVLLKAGAVLESGEGGSDSTRGTPLAAAARYGRLEAARVLIAAGASLTTDAKYSDGWVNTPIGQAVVTGNVEMIRLLRGAGSPLAEPGSGHGDTLLTQFAVDHDQLESLRYLLSVKAPTECRAGSTGCATPVLEALSSQTLGEFSDARMRELQMLLAAGANPNSNGFTSYLQFAMEGHRLPALKMLLKAGANPNAKNGDGKSMLSIALAADDEDAAAALRAFGAKP